MDYRNLAPRAIVDLLDTSPHRASEAETETMLINAFKRIDELERQCAANQSAIYRLEKTLQRLSK